MGKMRQVCMRIPQVGGWRGSDRENVCTICGKRVNKPRMFVRRAGRYMFRQGAIPDPDAWFSAVHPRCIERFGIDADEWTYTAAERGALEAEG